jgi:amino acid transporter
MSLAKSTKSSFKRPIKPLPKRIWSWMIEKWRIDPRPFISMILIIIVGFIAAILDLSSGWLFLLWLLVLFSVVFFGTCYFIWNLASIAIILMIERKQVAEWELSLLKYWLKRNIMIAGIWAGFLLLSVLAQPGWPILATANGVILAFIVMFAESEESPFETGERTADLAMKIQRTS